MIVRAYEPKDFEQISSWGKAYGNEYALEQFPKTGFIVDNIAAYFLYSTDSSVCFLENMIANKDVDAAQKEKALELIIQAILKEAKDKGFKVAYATTSQPSVILRAVKHGARGKISQVLLTKDLTDPSL